MTTVAPLRPGNHAQTVHDWCEQLASLCAGLLTRQEARLIAEELADAIGPDYPPGAFTHASLRHVARAFPRMPTYAELYATLGDWWASNRPRPARPALPGQAGQELSAGDRIAVEGWLSKRRTPGATREQQLSLIRWKFAAAFEYLIRNDTAAFELARRQGWIDGEEPQA